MMRTSIQSWLPGAHSVQGAPQELALSSHDLNGPFCALDLSPLLELLEVSLPLEDDFDLCPLEGSESSSVESVPGILGFLIFHWLQARPTGNNGSCTRNDHYSQR